MDTKKVIVCDLDGTLAVSKSPLSSDMAEVISHILERKTFAVVSGGGYRQFQKQFLSQLRCEPYLLKNLYLFPTMGSTCYVFNEETLSWKQLYDEPLSKKEKDSVKKALKEVLKELKMEVGETYGEAVEDRGSQITFSGLGQDAPIDLKETWDKDASKRRKIVEILEKKIPEFEIRIGGTTSIDITKKGLDKAYAIRKIEEILKVKKEEIIFVGDALYKGGNDEAVKSTGVDYIQEEGPNQTLELLSRYM